MNRSRASVCANRTLELIYAIIANIPRRSSTNVATISLLISIRENERRFIQLLLLFSFLLTSFLLILCVFCELFARYENSLRLINESMWISVTKKVKENSINAKSTHKTNWTRFSSQCVMFACLACQKSSLNHSIFQSIYITRHEGMKSLWKPRKLFNCIIYFDISCNYWGSFTLISRTCSDINQEWIL